MAGRLIGLCLIIASLASADDFSTQREAVLTLGQLTASPAWRRVAPLPEGTTAWFINVRSGKLTASSDYQEERKSP